MRAGFEPFYRASVGYDPILSMLEAAGTIDPAAQGPAYDIVKSGNDGYRVTIAVPGAHPDDVSVTQHDTLLIVTGKGRDETPGDYLHRGIASGGFECRFHVAHHVQVTEAALSNGLLTIDLKREVPEAMKPRTIPIETYSEARQRSAGLGPRPRPAAS